MAVSGGGITALQMELDYPGTVRRLVLCVAASRASEHARRELLRIVDLLVAGGTRDRVVRRNCCARPRPASPARACSCFPAGARQRPVRSPAEAGDRRLPRRTSLKSRESARQGTSVPPRLTTRLPCLMPRRRPPAARGGYLTGRTGRSTTRRPTVSLGQPREDRRRLSRRRTGSPRRLYSARNPGNRHGRARAYRRGSLKTARACPDAA